ncbi:MAG: L-rhamnose mutarotase [Sphingobacterium sp.]
MSKRYALAIDLINDPAMISAYEKHHQTVHEDIRKSITDAGVEVMDIYRFENRLFMIMEVNEQFSFEAKAAMDAENPAVQKWETLMWDYQQVIPGAKPGEKWVQMNQIFEL